MINIRTLFTFAALILLSSCQGKMQTREQLSRELNTYHSIAAEGTSEEAVNAGEKALAMMDFISLHEADEIVETGEENFMFEAFDESLQIFEMALAKNPNNPKALSYLALLRPFSSLKGARWRFREDEFGKSDLGLEIAQMQTYGEKPTNDMMMFFVAPYKNRLDSMQEAADEVLRPARNEYLRASQLWAKLRKIENLDVSLSLPRKLYNFPEMRIRQADAMVAESYSVGIALMTSWYIMYDWSGIPLTKDFDRRTKQSLWTEAVKNPKFGLLVDGEFLQTLKDKSFQMSQGLDIAFGLLRERLAKKQNSLEDLMQASQGTVNACNQEIFEHSIYYTLDGCLKKKTFITPLRLTFWQDSFRKDLQTHSVTNAEKGDGIEDLKKSVEEFKRAFMGPFENSIECSPGHSVKTWINLPAFIANPVTDFKTLGPVFNREGDIRTFKDRKFNGLFPNGYPCN